MDKKDNITIRRAQKKDIPFINTLLEQVLAVHHEGRPDLFKGNTKKYTDSELEKIIEDDKTPIFVAAENENIKGYAFCIFQKHENDNILTDIKTLYIDDLCVDEKSRGQHIGKSLYQFVLDFARQNGFYNVTLNVWSCNQNAIKFYEKCGLVPYKIGMEKLI